MRLKWLYVKATIYSLWAQIFVKFNQDYLLKKSIKNYPETPLKSKEQKLIVRQVSDVTRVIGARAPWNPMCLNLAYVTKKILKEHGINCTFRLGYLEGRPKNMLEGHAWITLDDKLIAGWLPNLKDYIEMTQPKQITKTQKTS